MAGLWSLCSLSSAVWQAVKPPGRRRRPNFPESTRYLSSKVRLTVPTKDAVFTVNGTMKLISGERMQLFFPHAYHTYRGGAHRK